MEKQAEQSLVPGHAYRVVAGRAGLEPGALGGHVGASAQQRRDAGCVTRNRELNGRRAGNIPGWEQRARAGDAGAAVGLGQHDQRPLVWTVRPRASHDNEDSLLVGFSTRRVREPRALRSQRATRQTRLVLRQCIQGPRTVSLFLIFRC